MTPSTCVLENNHWLSETERKDVKKGQNSESGLLICGRQLHDMTPPTVPNVSYVNFYTKLAGDMYDRLTTETRGWVKTKGR